MKIRILFSLFAGTLAYTVLSFVAGNNGVLVYNKLVEQKKAIARQTEVIQNINNELNLEYSALLRDKDVIAAYARKLDYVGDGEKLVKVKGLKPAQTELYDIGTILRKKNIPFISEKACKICGVVFFGLTLVLSLLIDLNSGKISFGSKNKVLVKGSPVYDIKQM